MSTPRRMFEDPRNTYIIENNDPGAFDKRFVGRPGVHREQQCCRDCAPVWEEAAKGPEIGPGSKTDFHNMYVLQVEDTTGVGNLTHGDDHISGRVYILGPKSGFKPDFISDTDWMHWQGVYWLPGPNPVQNMPNPWDWVHIGGDKKIRWSEHGHYEVMWCNKCETWLEGAWSDILDALPIVARGLAMVASYIPIYGTALSLVINTSVSLAEGDDVNEALVNSIGTCLPGQPASGMIYKTGVSIAKGERLDHAGIDGMATMLNLDKSVTDVLKAADEAIYHIATGQNIGDAAFDTIHQFLPPEAQQGVQLARRFINGEDVPEMILSQIEQVTADSIKESAQMILDRARSKGAVELNAAEIRVQGIYNQYAVEFGYQMALDRLPNEHRSWIQLGMAGGSALAGYSEQYIGTFGSIPESNVAENNSHAASGAELIASGIKYHLKPVSAILQEPHFTIVIDFYDAVNSVWTKREVTRQVTDAWRRGFTIAIGVCQGCSERGPGQLAVYQTLAERGERDGFDAGQAVQFNRTLFGDLGIDLASSVAQVDQTSAYQAARETQQADPSANFRDTIRATRPAFAPDFVGQTRKAAGLIAVRAGVAISDWIAEDADDTRGGEDLRDLMMAYTDQDGHEYCAHGDEELVGSDQEPRAGEPLHEGKVVKVAWVLAPGIMR